LVADLSDDYPAEHAAAGSEGLGYTCYLGLGVDQVVMRTDGSSQQWYYRDKPGSTAVVADGSGNALESYEYNAQGQFQVTLYGGGTNYTYSQSQIGNSILFAGRSYDTETSNYFYRARYYNPTLGRFISRDPLSGAEFSQGTNLYAYCRNNFLNATDPTGMCLLDGTLTLYGYYGSDALTQDFQNGIQTADTSGLSAPQISFNNSGNPNVPSSVTITTTDSGQWSFLPQMGERQR
jgi:RHS repeat-associated protein